MLSGICLTQRMRQETRVRCGREVANETGLTRGDESGKKRFPGEEGNAQRILSTVMWKDCCQGFDSVELIDALIRLWWSCWKFSLSFELEFSGSHARESTRTERNDVDQPYRVEPLAFTFFGDARTEIEPEIFSAVICENLAFL